jgi:high-affinity iron transporter
MLPTFVIGLREGLEAALIVGIVAAFLRKQGRRDLLRWVLIGVGVAIALCVMAGVALKIYSQGLPQRQQEGLETVIGVLAVGMVSYMVVWMRRNSRNLKGQLEGLAADAMSGASGAARALVLMAFLAVIREGIETVVFVLAAFNESGSGSSAGVGLLLGLVVAVALGYGIYRGGVRLNLSKFFRATGLVLVLVAAGILVNALHTAHEAGWLDSGQSSPFDLSWLVSPGTVQASLLTGMLGIQAHPALIEIVGWLAYLVPVGLYVAWPPGRSAPARALARGGAALGALAAVAALVLVLVRPDAPGTRPVTSAGAVRAQLQQPTAGHATLRTQAQQPIARTTGSPTDYRLASAGRQRHGGVDTDVYRATVAGTAAAGRPATLTLAQVAAANGGRLPIGLAGRSTSPTAALPAGYRDDATVTAWIDPATQRVVDVRWSEQVVLTVGTGANAVTIGPVATGTTSLPSAAVARAADAVRSAHSTEDRRSTVEALAVWCLILAVALFVLAAGFAAASLRRSRPVAPAPEPAGALVRS